MAADQCPACDSSNFTSRAEVPHPVCGDCGLVISDDVDPTLSPGNADNRDIKLQSWSEYYSITNSTEQQTADGLEILRELGSQLEVSSDAVQEAADLFAQASIENLSKGRSTRLIVAAALCAGARETAEARPTGSIAQKAGLEPNRLKHATRLLQRSLPKTPTASPPEHYFPYLRQELGLRKQTEEQAKRLLDAYSESVSQNGKNPVGIAGALLYSAAADEVTQREVADVSGITQETIRVRVKELRGTMEG